MTNNSSKISLCAVLCKINKLLRSRLQQFNTRSKIMFIRILHRYHLKRFHFLAVYGNL